MTKRLIKRPINLGFLWIVLISNSLQAQDRVPVMTFSSPDSSGKVYSIEDFRGKVVYLDVWATWCFPCRRQIPKLRDLKAEYAEEDSLVFLYVSIDHKYDRWIKFIERKELDGVHLFANNHFRIRFAEKYGIYAIPHFILIDKQGRVYQNDAARPGWPEITGHLDKLLSE